MRSGAMTKRNHTGECCLSSCQQVTLAIKFLCCINDGGKRSPEFSMRKCWMMDLVCKIQIQF